MRSLLICAFLVTLDAFGQQTSPVLAIPINQQFVDNPAIRGFFADLLKQGGYGRWKTERAAFLVLEESGEYRCVSWGFNGNYQRQQFEGAIPDRTVAIVHTHPMELPAASVNDQETAIRLSIPIFILTPENIYLVTPRGLNVAMIQNRSWAPATVTDDSSSTRCIEPRSARPSIFSRLRGNGVWGD